ncbi:hypothetical protein HYC85_007302 [Camellia sinensis]|uniref:Uncharacterized protein n=1 Tax=Camellia sinensis TaxID=4442 RepID=A0A7J7HQX1_CAMSI|nr:hypothetical protein HYC85_007302 [Camellia sinensis]
MEKIDGFVSAQPQRLLSLHTTHSPGFMGLNLRQNSGAWVGSNYGKGVIVGLLDTGVNPKHPSFNDKGVPPPPAKWKGKCEFKRTACNKKLIGARNFIPESTVGPFDDLGHGTHTASTAAGNFVRNASVFGQAKGTAAGMAPHAHLAIYKVCTLFGCFESDVLAGMDAAVEDGVDILSLSLGGSSIPFRENNIAKGAFGAMQIGIFASCSAGNSGPENASLANEAPWVLTVGASTIDRSITATAVLGDKTECDGQSLFQPTNFSSTLLPLVYAGTSNPTLAFCDPLLLIDVNLKGKVVLCEAGGDIENVKKGQAVKDAGGVAMIIMNQERDGFTILAEAHVLPATHVSYIAGQYIKEYIKSTKIPTSTIVFKGTIVGDKLAPMVSSFSSRGPSLASPGILKPDVIGPGVNILAAWPISIENKTNSRLTFNTVSGTSMSCPHLSGIAALLKSAHPNWSSAAIKSAIMTTTDRANHLGKPIIDETLFPADIFVIGSGHVNPSRAINPGLVYDLKPNDYIPYLCGLNYTDQDIYFITKHTVKCSKVSKIAEAQLNYPSFSITLGSGHQTYTRTVTNVGEANSSYDSVIVAPAGVNVTLNTTRLEFSEVNQKITYQVTFSRGATGGDASFVHGILSWTSSNSIQFVRSPISVKLVRGK